MKETGGQKHTPITLLPNVAMYLLCKWATVCKRFCYITLKDEPFVLKGSSGALEWPKNDCS